MSEWISCEDKLPKTFETVNVTDGILVFPGFYNINTRFWLAWSGYKYMNLNLINPSHWMPLPKPPIDD